MAGAKWTPDKLRKGIDEYFDECAAKREFADYPNMLIYLGLSEDGVAEMLDDSVTKNAEEYRAHFEYAKLKRKGMLIRQMVKDQKNANGCKIALAMPENGGFTEKAAEKQDRKITIKQTEETAELFK